jgi:hypothetical protein
MTMTAGDAMVAGAIFMHVGAGCLVTMAGLMIAIDFEATPKGRP